MRCRSSCKELRREVEEIAGLFARRRRVEEVHAEMTVDGDHPVAHFVDLPEQSLGLSVKLEREDGGHVRIYGLTEGHRGVQAMRRRERLRNLDLHRFCGGASRGAHALRPARRPPRLRVRRVEWHGLRLLHQATDKGAPAVLIQQAPLAPGP